MAWTREFHLFLNTDLTPGAILLRDKAGQAAASRPEWVAADKFPVHLWLRKPSDTNGVSATAVTIEPTDKIILSGKVNAGGALLFSAIDWAPTGEGDSARYVAELDLNTEALLAAFIGNTTQLLVTCEIEIQNEANTARISAQFTVMIRKQVYAGEGTPTPAAPVYPLPNAIVTYSGGAGFRFVNGYLQLRDIGANEWRGVFLEDGVLAFTAADPAAAAGGDFYRFAGNHLQLRDSVTDGWRTLFLADGGLALGPEESV